MDKDELKMVKAFSKVSYEITRMSEDLGGFLTISTQHKILRPLREKDFKTKTEACKVLLKILKTSKSDEEVYQRTMEAYEKIL